MDLSPTELRQEAKRLRAIAAKYEELAELLEAGAIEMPSIGQTKLLAMPASKTPSKKKGESWRRVILAAATFGDSTFSASDIVSAVSNEVPEQTVYAIFRRDGGRDFAIAGTDPKNERVTLYKLKEYAWVFTYGLNMNGEHLKQEFNARGFDYESLVIGSCIAELPNCRLSWRNESVSRWNCGTATFDEEPGQDLQGIAYLVRAPRGIQAFEAKEKPAYVREQREILIGGKRVPANVFNVAPTRRAKQDVQPSAEYLDMLLSGAKAHGLELEIEGRGTNARSR